MVDELRGSGRNVDAETLIRLTEERLKEQRRPVLRRVINGTGILLHTNLGRSPLGGESIESIRPMLTGFADLEWDADEGGRGDRGAAARRRLARLYGAEAAIVVNNNAAAILLALRALAGSRGEVLVSRGELVAIGGGFKIPEILQIAGCRLVEVGTTNRTTARDFEKAIGKKTRLILRVTPSNFIQSGFVGSPETSELSDLAHRHGFPLLVDQGSGAPVPLDRYGLTGVGTVADSLDAGADLVAASGDKLLGGPQAGIVAGKAELIRKLAADPFYRAIRPGRFSYLLLGEVAGAHLAGKAEQLVPLYRMLAQSPADLELRGEKILRGIGPPASGFRIRLIESRAAVGGGTTPGHEIESRALALRPGRGASSSLAGALRRNAIPVATRAQSGEVLVDLRSVLPEEDEALTNAIAGSCQARPESRSPRHESESRP